MGRRRLILADFNVVVGAEGANGRIGLYGGGSCICRLRRRGDYVNVALFFPHRLDDVHAVLSADAGNIVGGLSLNDQFRLLRGGARCPNGPCQEPKEK